MTLLTYQISVEGKKNTRWETQKIEEQKRIKQGSRKVEAEKTPIQTKWAVRGVRACHSGLGEGRQALKCVCVGCDGW